MKLNALHGHKSQQNWSNPSTEISIEKSIEYRYLDRNPIRVDKNPPQRLKSDPPTKFSTKISRKAPWVTDRQTSVLKPQKSKNAVQRMCCLLPRWGYVLSLWGYVLSAASLRLFAVCCLAEAICCLLPRWGYVLSAASLRLCAVSLRLGSSKLDWFHSK